MDIKRFIGGILEANCYIISDGSPECFIIDPGYNAKKIINYINDNSLEAKAIILTHHHSDHSGAAARVRKELGAPIWIHRADADQYREPADRLLEDGDILEAGGVKLQVINTPGHTKGGICLMSARDKVCFTGDTIFNVDLGRTDLGDGSEQEMVHSIRDIVDGWGNDITIYPGHGDPATMKKVRKINQEFLEIVNGN